MRFGWAVVLLALVNKWTVRAIDRKATGWALETEEQVAEVWETFDAEVTVDTSLKKRLVIKRDRRPDDGKGGSDLGRFFMAEARVWVYELQ